MPTMRASVRAAAVEAELGLKGNIIEEDASARLPWPAPERSSEGIVAAPDAAECNIVDSHGVPGRVEYQLSSNSLGRSYILAKKIVKGEPCSVRSGILVFELVVERRYREGTTGLARELAHDVNILERDVTHECVRVGSVCNLNPASTARVHNANIPIQHVLDTPLADRAHRRAVAVYHMHPLHEDVACARLARRALLHDDRIISALDAHVVYPDVV